MNIAPGGHPFGCLIVIAALAGCSPNEHGTIAARVNGETILADEVDLALQYHGVAGHDPRARQRQLERLVIEELLAQQFLRSTPGSAEVDESVVSSARRAALARRYVMDLVGGIARPRADEITAFYREHPSLFAQRRIYTFRQLDLVAPPTALAEARRRLRAAESVDELVEWLRRTNLRFTSSDIERGSDELSDDLLAQLDRLASGEVGVLEGNRELRIVQLAGVRPAPLDEKSAWPIIEERLWRERRAATVEAEVRRLSRLAAIAIPEDTAPGAIRALVPEQPLAVPRIPAALPPAVQGPDG